MLCLYVAGDINLYNLDLYMCVYIEQCTDLDMYVYLLFVNFNTY